MKHTMIENSPRYQDPILKNQIYYNNLQELVRRIARRGPQCSVNIFVFKLPVITSGGDLANFLDRRTYPIIGIDDARTIKKNPIIDLVNQGIEACSYPPLIPWRNGPHDSLCRLCKFLNVQELGEPSKNETACVCKACDYFWLWKIAREINNTSTSVPDGTYACLPCWCGIDGLVVVIKGVDDWFYATSVSQFVLSEDVLQKLSSISLADFLGVPKFPSHRQEEFAGWKMKLDMSDMPSAVQKNFENTFTPQDVVRLKGAVATVGDLSEEEIKTICRVLGSIIKELKRLVEVVQSSYSQKVIKSSKTGIEEFKKKIQNDIEKVLSDHQIGLIEMKRVVNRHLLSAGSNSTLNRYRSTSLRYWWEQFGSSLAKLRKPLGRHLLAVVLGIISSILAALIFWWWLGHRSDGKSPAPGSSQRGLLYKPEGQFISSAFPLIKPPTYENPDPDKIPEDASRSYLHRT